MESISGVYDLNRDGLFTKKSNTELSTKQSKKEVALYVAGIVGIGLVIIVFVVALTWFSWWFWVVIVGISTKVWIILQVVSFVVGGILGAIQGAMSR